MSQPPIEPHQWTHSPAPRYRRRGVVAVIVEGNRFLTIRRSAQVTAPLKLCFPGGGIEAGETPRVALFREMQEELGVDVLPQMELWTSTTPWGTFLYWWTAHLPTEFVLKPEPLEVAEVMWMTAEELLQREDVLASVPQFIEANRDGLFQL